MWYITGQSLNENQFYKFSEDHLKFNPCFMTGQRHFSDVKAYPSSPEYLIGIVSIIPDLAENC